MKLVLIIDVRGDADVLDAQLAYHLNAGVDLVIASDRDAGAEAKEILSRYERDGLLVRAPEGSSRTQMAELAVELHQADWVIDALPDDFWWPRGESLKDVLVAIPARYSIVQGLERVFLPSRDEAGFFADRMTVRESIAQLQEARHDAEALPLRPVYRAGPRMMIGGDDAARAGRVPLRAWYPIEVLRFPNRRSDASAPGDDQVTRAVANGSLVVDERLRDALRTLRGDGGFRLPVDGVGGLAFRAPDVVDDAAYAVECAAVGEVDLARLDRHIRELEARIAFLEERLWPRVLRTFSRLRRSGG